MDELKGISVGAGTRRGILIEYEGVRVADGRRVRVTLLPRELGRHCLARTRYLSQARSRIGHESLSRELELVDLDEGLLVVAEQPAGERLTLERPLPVDALLIVSRSVAAALAALHAAGSVHGSVRPASIFFDSKTGRVTLVGPYVNVAALSDWEPAMGNEVLLEMLTYAAPEQSGRTQVAVDHRIDLYSLGATLYALAAGAPPLIAGDALQLMHALLAIVPRPLAEVRPDLPRSLSRIIDRLLAKSPDDRYQSAAGVLHDVERCQREVSERSVSDFMPGQRDWSGTLSLPHRLYARGADRGALRAALDTVIATAKPLLHEVLGGPGIGKSALVAELRPEVLARRGYFVSGKFGQYVGDVPYAALAESFRELAGLLLMDGQERLDALASSFARTMGGLGGVIVRFAPRLELVFGEQPPLAELAPAEAHSRFLVAIERFVSVIAAPEHPLVLFLDDLQWADPASLDALRALVLPAESLPILLVVSYRDSGVDATHRAALALDALARAGVPRTTQHLAPLDLSAARELVAAALHRPAEEVEPLARIVYAKTFGNPFHIRALLSSLVDSGALRCDPDAGWQWDERRAATAGADDDVGRLLSQQLEHLPPHATRILETLALVDTALGLHLVARLCELSTDAFLEALEPAVAAHLVVVARDGVVFAHDKVAEAAYARISPARRAALHAAFARLLLGELDEAARERHVFEVVRHLLAGVSLLDASERASAVRYALLGAHHAKSSGAYALGASLVQTALGIVPDTPEQRSTAWRLRQELAELSYLAGDFAGSERAAAELLARATEPVERAVAYSTFIVQYNMSARYEEALDCAREGLAAVGVDLPDSDDGTRFRAELERGRALQGERSMADLLTRAERPGRDKRTAIEILGLAISTCYLTRPELLPVAVELMTNLSLEHGHVAYSCYAYSHHGFLLAADGDYAGGHAYAELGMKLAERMADPVQQCRTSHLSAFFLHYVKPYREADALYELGFRLGVESGEFEFACYHAHTRAARGMLDGTPLSNLSREVERLGAFAHKVKNVIAADTLDAVRLTIDGWLDLGDAAQPCSRAPGDTAHIQRWTTSHSSFAVFVYRVLASWLAYASERFGDALDELEQARGLARYAPNHVCLPLIPFVDSLCRLARRGAVDDVTRRRDWRAIEQSQAELALLARASPANYLSKHSLVSAEMGRVQSGMWAAGALYDEARDQARAAGLVADEALANELAARGWLAIGKSEFARDYQAAALAAYERWGATRKVDELERALGGGAAERRGAGSPQRQGLEQALDAATLMKAALAISSSISLDDVVEHTLRAAIENAGARRGVLALRSGDELRVVAAAEVGKDAFHYRTAVPLSQARELLLQPLVQLASRTGVSQLVDDASHEPALAHDPYVVRHSPRSALAIPSISQGKVIAVTYLDNELVAGAFAAQRVELLGLIAAQAAVSLQNAMLYNAVLDSEGFVRSLVESSPAEISVLDREQKICFLNRVQPGFRLEDILGQPASRFWTPETAALARQAVARVVDSGQQADYEAALRMPDGGERWFQVRVGPIFRNGRVERVVEVATDITDARKVAAERAALEAQLEQVRKLEAIGQLAGGVAHDFNNLLTTIIGNVELVRLALDDVPSIDASVESDLDEVVRACDRAAAMTRQLLTFCRKDIVAPVVFDAGERLQDIKKLLVRLLPATVRLTVEVAPGRHCIKADPNQFEQVVLNLSVNARDAMPSGGALRISVDSVTVRAEREADRPALNVVPRDHVLLRVQDTGVGIAPDLLGKIFEPFFTTKPAGRGTGLGLATVHGIVMRAHGHIDIDSQPGVGTTFDVYFPAVDARPSRGAAPERRARATRGKERVLVCEDDAAIRALLVRALDGAGYAVNEASDGAEALRAFDGPTPRPDLLITDVVMPEVDGARLTSALRARFPGLPVLYISGYAHDALDTGELQGSVRLLQKPFTPRALLEQVRALLDAARREP